MQTNRGDPPPLVEWGVASLALSGQVVSGDMHVVQPFANGVLLAVVDGVGHGAAAAAAAQVAVATLRAHAHEDVLPLLERCHEALRPTRGAVLTVASCNARAGTLSWAGVGSVEGVLLRGNVKEGAALRDCQYVLLPGGVVGLQLPPFSRAVP